MSTSSRYTLAMLQDEVYELIQRKQISRRQPISALAQYFSARDWQWMEQELEYNDFLLRDPIGELISHEEWHTD